MAVNPSSRAKKAAIMREQAKGHARRDDATEGNFLRLLGERVRNARLRRGMTRKILGRDSGVSERYLAQIESGRGNLSIILLRQIARAMSMPVAELVREGPEPGVELASLTERLARLEPNQLAAAQAWLTERFGATVERRGRIALIGLRGAGKTTLGRALARRLGVAFVELVKEIETEAGMRLSEIFDLYGQSVYRRYERQALERAICVHDRAVIATGGGLPTEPGTFALLRKHCRLIWLRATPEEHMARVRAQGDTRPMAGNRQAMDDLRQILAQRAALYRQADAVLDTSGQTVGQSLDELFALIQLSQPITA